ncbi:MAG: glycosyltransferase [Planctomycetes bacterium]|nr:glycosyltransferase [Planctomycetota bacterium]
MTPRLTIVIPMLNEELNIRPLFGRLFTVLDGLDLIYEVICVNDGSKDRTPEILAEEAESRHQLRVINFARNFGQHAAVMAGFDYAKGEWIITLDADLQNPPEEIPKIVAEFEKGHDLVNTIRQGRQDTWFRKTASKIVNNVMRKFSGINLKDFGCMLRGYHANVAKPMCKRREFHTFIPALATLYAGNPVEIPVAHAGREHGASNYSLRKLFSLQLDLIASFSLTPLRLLFTLGAGIAVFSILFAFLLICVRLYFGATWAGEGVFTVFAVLFFLIGAQFFAFGLLGEYIGRIYQEVRDRPAYLVSEIVSFRQSSVPDNRGDRVKRATDVIPSAAIEPERDAGKRLSAEDNSSWVPDEDTSDTIDTKGFE